MSPEKLGKQQQNLCGSAFGARLLEFINIAYNFN